MNALANHPLVRSIRPPVQLELTDQSAADVQKRDLADAPVEIPEPSAQSTYPIVGVIDSGVAEVLGDWVIDRFDYLDGSEHDPNDETEPLAFVQLQLPALAGVPLETVLDIRKREQRAFHRFTHHFYAMIKDHEGSLAREQDLIDAIKGVDDAVEELMAEFQRIRRELVFSNVEAGVSLTVCCLSLFLPLEYVAFLSALFGGKAGSTALKSFRNYSNDISRLRNNECYIPWLIAHEHGKG